MNNIQAVERFEQTHGSMIEKLFWIAGSYENRDFKDLIEEMTNSDFKDCFPEIYKSDYFNGYKKDNELLQSLADFSKFGFIAEIHIPQASEFSYKNNKPVSWSLHGGICRVRYVYAETRESLISEIEKASEKVFKEYLKEDKKKRKS